MLLLTVSSLVVLLERGPQQSMTTWSSLLSVTWLFLLTSCWFWASTSTNLLKSSKILLLSSTNVSLRFCKFYEMRL